MNRPWSTTRYIALGIALVIAIILVWLLLTGPR
jgi:hypothetical protein